MRLSASVSFLAVVTSAPVALAQGIDDFGAYGGMERRGLERSPQEIAFEIRVGPYNPNVDDELGGTPYEDTFGGKQRWHGGFEVDWQGLRIPQTLSLGPGFGAHYTISSARAPLESGEGRSAQETSLTIVPLHLVGVLRVDALADRLNIPFCPYAKLGIGYAFWWSDDGDKTATDDNGVQAKDTSYGLVYSLGISGRLDWLDPDDAASADASLGINHSSIFIEYFSSNLNGFGSNSVMQVGTKTYVFGVMLEI